jgi:hypothetical protein
MDGQVDIICKRIPINLMGGWSQVSGLVIDGPLSNPRDGSMCS